MSTRTIKTTNAPGPRAPVAADSPHFHIVFSFSRYLENIAFPKSREAILQVIEENTENDTEDNEHIMERFRQIPDVVYNSIEDVRKALGEEYENYGVVKQTEEKNVQASKTK